MSDDSDDLPRRTLRPRGAATGSRRPRDESESPQRNTKKSKTADNQPDEDEDLSNRNDDESNNDNASADAELPEEQYDSETDSRVRSRQLPARQGPQTKEGRNAEAAIVSLIDELLISNDPNFKNARRIARSLKGLKLLRRVKPATQVPSEVLLSEYLARAPVDGRDYRPLSRRRDARYSRWLFSFKEGNATAQAASTGFQVPYGALPTDASLADQLALHNELARMYNTFPHNIPGLAHTLKQQFLSIAVSNVFARPLQIDEVTHNNTVTYQTMVHYIDPVTGAHNRTTVSATATDAAMEDVTVPALPRLNVLQTRDQSVIEMSSSNPYHVAPPDFSKGKALGKYQKTSTQSQHRAEDAVYWIASQLQGLVATKARMDQLKVMYREEIGLQKGARTQEGLYGNEADLYSFWYRRSNHSTLVAPTKKVAADLGLTKDSLSLYVFSLNASRATPVMETIIQLYCDGRDPREVWIEAAKSADLVNMDIRDKVAPSSRCNCDDSATHTELHPCEGCGKPVLCVTRSCDSMGRLVCVRCVKRDLTSGFGGRRPGESLAAFLTHRSLWLNFKKECEINGMDAKAQKSKDIFDAAWLVLKARLQGNGVANNLQPDAKTKYVDEWNGLEFDLGEERALLGDNPSRRRVIPHGLTVDSIHREGHPDNHGLRHSGSNLAITSNGCQLAKGAFNPGILHEGGEFMRLSAEQQALDSTREALIDKMMDMAIVNCKRAYINAGSGSKAAKYEKIVAEQVAGKPTPDEPGPWEQDARQFVQGHVPPYKPGGQNLWSEETWSGTQECARTTEDYFGVKLYQLRDGTRWMGNKHSNPKDLDRNGVVMLCRERLRRMRLDCNKKWVTVDTDEALYQEILFQHCCSITKKPELQWLKKKYGDRLGLPLVLWKHSPLRLSIAHRIHGFGMFSGWISASPRHVQERLDHDPDQNLLTESWELNAAKLDMAEDYYPELNKILKTAEITDKSIYNPAATFLASTAVPSTDEVSVQDDFVTATFNIGAPDVSPDDVEQEGSGSLEQDAAGLSGDGTGDLKETIEDEVTHSKAVERRAAVEKPVSDLDDGISAVYEHIMKYEGLRNQITFDPDFRRLLASLQQYADAGDESEFDVCMGRVFEEYINKAENAESD